MTCSCSGGFRSKPGTYPPPPLGARGAGAGLADLKEEPPTRPPDLAAKAASGDPALSKSAAATAAVSGRAKGFSADSACSRCGR